MTPLEVARVALLDLGRPDLAERIAWYDNIDGGFIDVLDEIDPDDHAVLDKAENLARASAAPVAIGDGGVRPTQAKDW